MSECRVAAIGRELAKLSRQFAEVDAEGVNLKGTRKLRLERQELEILDRIDTLKAEACCTPAASLPGAMVQAILAYDLSQELGSFIPDGSASGEAHALTRAVRRALYSAVDAMAATAGTDPDSFGADHFMRRDLHPFHLMEGAADKRESVG
eukprot:jgi/Tetstr1/460462/TSEL_005721.t1